MGDDHYLAWASPRFIQALVGVCSAPRYNGGSFVAMQFAQDDAELSLNGVRLFAGDRMHRTIAEQGQRGVFQLLAGAYQSR